MTFTSTISTKRQLTIPAQIFEKMNLRTGDKLTLSLEGNHIIMAKQKAILDELAGSLPPLPPAYKDLSPNELVHKAKNKYFAKKYSNE